MFSETIEQMPMEIDFFIYRYCWTYLGINKILEWNLLPGILFAEEMEGLHMSYNSPENDLRPLFKIQATKIMEFEST